MTVMAITIFYSAHKPMANEQEQAVEKAVRSGQIQSVQEVQPYNGTSTIMTVLGKIKRVKTSPFLYKILKKISFRK